MEVRANPLPLTQNPTRSFSGICGHSPNPINGHHAIMTEKESAMTPYRELGRL
jgi:hypothetical protein